MVGTWNFTIQHWLKESDLHTWPYFITLMIKKFSSMDACDSGKKSLSLLVFICFILLSTRILWSKQIYQGKKIYDGCCFVSLPKTKTTSVMTVGSRLTAVT